MLLPFDWKVLEFGQSSVQRHHRFMNKTRLSDLSEANQTKKTNFQHFFFDFLRICLFSAESKDRKCVKNNTSGDVQNDVWTRSAIVKVMVWDAIILFGFASRCAITRKLNFLLIKMIGNYKFQQFVKKCVEKIYLCRDNAVWIVEKCWKSAGSSREVSISSCFPPHHTSAPLKMFIALWIGRLLQMSQRQWSDSCRWTNSLESG